MIKKFIAVAIITCTLSTISSAQVNEDKLGAWYMYFYNTTFKSGPWGVQGDVQHRNWNLGGDMEQLMLRSGLTYKHDSSKVKLTLGYANITTGEYGKSASTVNESRIYQEALFPAYLGGRLYTTHRLRYEQRFVENQNFRTRYRYNLFVNVPLNTRKIEAGTVYLALYNELFINAERQIGNGQSVQFFDRNRAYAAIGYQPENFPKIQLGVMNQTTNSISKNQIQLSLHHKIR